MGAVQLTPIIIVVPMFANPVTQVVLVIVLTIAVFRAVSRLLDTLPGA
jgi:hypothetical protein